MKKKSSNRKHKSIHSSYSKKDSFNLYFSILRPVVPIVGVVILITVLYPLITAKKIHCANSISCKSPPTFEMETNAIGVYRNKPVSVPNIYLSQNENTNPVLGEHTRRGEKHIYVNLTTQTLTAYEGSVIFMQTPISSGLWGKTPKGEFTIWTKFRSTRMTGGSGDEYYDLPNVPYVMFFSNDEIPGDLGFSIHGTYWHNNFGHAMSHGCVNMKTTDAAKLYYWADSLHDGNIATKITIYE